MPLLDEALGFVEDALAQVQENQAKIAAQAQHIARLQSDLASKEKVILEKVASANAPVFNPEKLENLFDHLESIKAMTPLERAKVANHVKKDPNLIFPLIEKLSSILRRPDSEGAAVDMGDILPSQSTTDPDGWDQMCDGKPVKLHS
jgi:predicted Zn-dependent peptidase